MQDFIKTYLQFTDGTEAPKIYHRWALLTTMGAAIGRNAAIPFGDGKIFPTMYTMLLGDPGARKSTAIKLAAKMLGSAGYTTFAATRSTREKFLLDLEGLPEEEFPRYGRKKNRHIEIDETDINLWGKEAVDKAPKEVYIVADEFNDFIGAGDINFYTTLNVLWDWDNITIPYEDKVKNSKSISIWQPTVSMLGGNTQENFARAFPPELLGHGFLTRMIFIHGANTGKKIAFPTIKTADETTEIVAGIRERMLRSRREYTAISTEAYKAIEDIYNKHPGISDVRFRGYNTRRHTHLLKICIIMSLLLAQDRIEIDTVIYANTILSAAERLMPTAIGEFGKSKSSETANKIIAILNDAQAPKSNVDIYKLVYKDLNKTQDLNDILSGLVLAGKIQHVPGGFLPKKEIMSEGVFTDFDLLSEEERKML